MRLQVAAAEQHADAAHGDLPGVGDEVGVDDAARCAGARVFLDRPGIDDGERRHQGRRYGLHTVGVLQLDRAGVGDGRGARPVVVQLDRHRRRRDGVWVKLRRDRGRSLEDGDASGVGEGALRTEQDTPAGDRAAADQGDRRPGVDIGQIGVDVDRAGPREGHVGQGAVAGDGELGVVGQVVGQRPPRRRRGEGGRGVGGDQIFQRVLVVAGDRPSHPRVLPWPAVGQGGLEEVVGHAEDQIAVQGAARLGDELVLAVAVRASIAAKVDVAVDHAAVGDRDTIGVGQVRAGADVSVQYSGGLDGQGRARIHADVGRQRSADGEGATVFGGGAQGGGRGAEKTCAAQQQLLPPRSTSAHLRDHGAPPCRLSLNAT